MSPRYWRSNEKALLIDEYPHVSSKELARRLGKSQRSVRSMAFLLGLKKSEQFMAVDRHDCTRKYHSERRNAL